MPDIVLTVVVIPNARIRREREDRGTCPSADSVPFRYPRAFSSASAAHTLRQLNHGAQPSCVHLHRCCPPQNYYWCWRAPVRTLTPASGPVLAHYRVNRPSDAIRSATSSLSSPVPEIVGIWEVICTPALVDRAPTAQSFEPQAQARLRKPTPKAAGS